MIVAHVRAGTQKRSRIGANGERRRTAVVRLDGETILGREGLEGEYREYRVRSIEKKEMSRKKIIEEGRRDNGDENDRTRP